MRIGAFQFAASDNLGENHKIITGAIEQAASAGVRLLVFQECATCGYPPIERPNAKGIDFEALQNNIKKIAALANKYNMYIAVGTITQRDMSLFNSIQLINPQGETMGVYDKRALWGWDTAILSDFSRGSKRGVFSID